MFGTVPDLLRLVALPAFGWAAYRDVRTRRVPNRLWPPLAALGAVLLAWELWATPPFTSLTGRLFLIRVAASLFVVAPMGYLFWRLGGFGGADAKALMTLAVLLPTYPTYFLPVGWLPALPAVETTLGVFSLTVLTNTVVVGMVYPFVLALGNAASGRFSPVMFLARVVAVADLPSVHGRLFETREGFTRSGLDVDALRMYLRWRGTSLAALRADPETHRNPESVGETFDPTDGAVDAGPRTDGGPQPDDDAGTDPTPTTEGDDFESNEEVTDGKPAADGAEDSGVAPTTVDDPWAAEAFLDDVERSAYGTTPEQLREGLETVCEREAVWVSPGLPFLVPMFVGLAVALTVGDVLFAFLLALGAV